jgi:PBP1b-binding outer membrane lipoprotein LpoB
MLVRAGLVMTLVLAGCSSALAQAASVTDIQAISTNVTSVNGGGFSIVSNGGLSYDGPLNAITPLDNAIGVRIEINDQVLLDGVPAEVQALVDSGRARSNSLSPELEKARLDVSAANTVSLGIGGRVPMPIAIGGSLESLRIVQVDGQSWSVFPDLQPSVFNRSSLVAQ